jgi:hypothetical protein
MIDFRPFLYSSAVYNIRPSTDVKVELSSSVDVLETFETMDGKRVVALKTKITIFDGT